MELANLVWAHKRLELKGASDLYDHSTLSKLFQSSQESFIQFKGAINEFKDFIHKNRVSLPGDFIRYAHPFLHRDSDYSYIPYLLAKDFKGLERRMDNGFWNWYG